MTEREPDRRPDRRPLMWAGVIALSVAAIVALRMLRPGEAPTADDAGDSTGESAATAPSRPSDLLSGARGSPRYARAPRTPSPLRLSAAHARDDAAASSGALRGHVVSTASGRGVGGAELLFEHEGRTSSVRTDPEGAFDFRATAEGTWSLAAATADGYLPFAPAWGTSPVRFRASPGRVVDDVVIQLAPLVDYRGLVLDEAGEPVADAEVRLLGSFASDDALFPLEDTWTSRADGAFLFHAPDGAVLEATHPDHGSGRAALGFAAETSHSLVIRLSRAAHWAATSSIRGVVVTPDGEPVARADVRADREGRSRAAAGGDLAPWVSSTTDDEGRFALDGLDDGDYTVVARAEGWGATGEPGVSAGTRDLVLRLARESVLVGTVRDAHGPVPAATLVVERRDGPLMRTVVATASTFDADGRYEVHGLPPGDYVVTGVAQGYAPSSEVLVYLTPDRPTEADVLLRAGGTIRGRVTSGEHGSPIVGARASLEGRLGGGGEGESITTSTSATTDRAGRFAISGVAPGAFSLFVAAEGHHGRILSGLSMPEGGAVTADVDLTPTEPGEEPRIELAGVGAVLSASGDVLVIGQVIAGGGAAEVGLVPGDAILAVDGTPVTDLGFAGSIDRIRGPEGSSVVLRVRRADGTVTDLAVPRRRVRA